jgi:hypothetical protein
MDLKDATLMMLTESAGHPAVATIAKSAYDTIVDGDVIDYRVLNDLIGEASGKGVLRALRQKYGPTAFDAIIMPICQEIGHQAPIKSSRQAPEPGAPDDPLTAAVWPPR